MFNNFDNDWKEDDFSDFKHPNAPDVSPKTIIRIMFVAILLCVVCVGYTNRAYCIDFAKTKYEAYKTEQAEKEAAKEAEKLAKEQAEAEAAKLKAEEEAKRIAEEETATVDVEETSEITTTDVSETSETTEVVETKDVAEASSEHYDNTSYGHATYIGNNDYVTLDKNGNVVHVTLRPTDKVLRGNDLQYGTLYYAEATDINDSNNTFEISKIVDTEGHEIYIVIYDSWHMQLTFRNIY